MSEGARELSVIILAAGKGKRLAKHFPHTPKVLLPLKGKRIIDYTLDNVYALKPKNIFLVVGYKAEQVIEAVARPQITFVRQDMQLGTGHAVEMVREHLDETSGDFLVLYGDMPLVRLETLIHLIDLHLSQPVVASMLVAERSEETESFGRVILDDKGNVSQIVEVKDCDKGQFSSPYVNPGIYIFEGKFLFEALAQVGFDNAQGEKYLTDVIGIAIRQGHRVSISFDIEPAETLGLNTLRDYLRLKSLFGDKS